MQISANCLVGFVYMEGLKSHEYLSEWTDIEDVTMLYQAQTVRQQYAQNKCIQ